jgi:hypothetical protein
MSDTWVSWDEVAEEFGETLARRLAAHTDHRDLQGTPCWERERLEELLELVASEVTGSDGSPGGDRPRMRLYRPER